MGYIPTSDCLKDDDPYKIILHKENNLCKLEKVHWSKIRERSKLWEDAELIREGKNYTHETYNKWLDDEFFRQRGQTLVNELEIGC